MVLIGFQIETHKLVENHTERRQIRACIQSVTSQLLRRHEVRVTQWRAYGQVGDLGTFEIVVGVPNGGGQKYPRGNEYKRDLRTVVLVLAGMLVSTPLQDGHSYDCQNWAEK